METSPRRAGVWPTWAVPLLLAFGTCATHAASTQPGAYASDRDRSTGSLILSTPYYAIRHDKPRGGVIDQIQLVYGRATNLLVQPMGTLVRDEHGTAFTDLNDPSPRIQESERGNIRMVSVRARLLDGEARELKGLRLNTTFEYHWGYLKIRKEFTVRKQPVSVKQICALTMTLNGDLSAWGLREGITEKEGAPPFSFGSCRWGRISDATSFAPTNYLPRYAMFANPGVDGLEWFMGSDLKSWEVGLTGRRGDGQFEMAKQQHPLGIQVSISPFHSSNPMTLTNSVAFTYFIGLPLLEGHAHQPWFHTSFNRNRGEWVSPEQVRRWAESGIQSVHCHNDGDYYNDGLFWRDGAYPPYPDMDGYDRVIRDCRGRGLRVATYFSNKELHPSTPEFRTFAPSWARKDSKGKLQHNLYRGTNEFGAQMCLRSGWLHFLEGSIDRVLRNHPLNGVYYDWNVALLCWNDHEPTLASTGLSAAPHWDIEELLELMEWTRRRVGPEGLVIIHNTTTPMFATENFADHVVANEWGYGKWTGDGPEPAELPLEWSLVGARSRGVISYGQIPADAPAHMKKLFALEALLGGVTPWPAGDETFEIFSVIKPIGNLEVKRFADWRNPAVKSAETRAYSVVYSRPGESFLILANLEKTERYLLFRLFPAELPHPMAGPRSATLIDPKSGEQTRLDVNVFTAQGLRFQIPPTSAVLVKIQE